jgi:hypothetical protein
MWLLLATAITVATPSGATLDSSQVTYTRTQATLAIALTRTDATIATATIDLPPDARVTAMRVTTAGGPVDATRVAANEQTARYTARLDFVDKTRTRQRLRLSVAAAYRVKIDITIELVDQPHGYVSWFSSLVAIEPARDVMPRIQRVLHEPTYCGVGR